MASNSIMQIKITPKPQKSPFKIVHEGLCVMKNFLDIRSEEDDDHCYVESPFFHTSPASGPANEFKWSLDVHTDGCEGYPEYVSLRFYLIDNRLYSFDEMPDLRFFACIIDEDGKKFSTKWTDIQRINHEDTCFIIIKDFVPRKELQNNPKLLPGGELRIWFEVSFDTENAEKELMSKYASNQMKILNDVFDAGKYTDFKLVVGEKVFGVHRAILAAHSPVFEAMFDTEMRESSEGTVNIIDVEAAVMDKLLRFVYSGNVESIDNHADKLLVAADKYQIDVLKALCEKILADRVCLDNIYDILRLSDENNAEQLKKKAIQFFQSNAKNLHERANFKDNLDLLPSHVKSDIICALIVNINEESFLV